MDKYLSEIAKLESQVNDMKEQDAFLEVIIEEIPDRIEDDIQKLDKQKNKLNLLNEVKSIKNSSFLKYIASGLKNYNIKLFKRAIKFLIDFQPWSGKYNIILNIETICMYFLLGGLLLFAVFNPVIFLIFGAPLVLLNLVSLGIGIYRKNTLNKSDIDKEILEAEEEIKMLSEKMKTKEIVYQRIKKVSEELGIKIDDVSLLIESLCKEREEAITTLEPELNRCYEAKRTRQKPRDREA